MHRHINQIECAIVDTQRGCFKKMVDDGCINATETPAGDVVECNRRTKPQKTAVFGADHRQHWMPVAKIGNKGVNADLA